MNAQNISSCNKIVLMAIPFADILQDGDLPVCSLGAYMHFNDIVFYAPSERILTERAKPGFVLEGHILGAFFTVNRKLALYPAGRVIAVTTTSYTALAPDVTTTELTCPDMTKVTRPISKSKSQLLMFVLLNKCDCLVCANKRMMRLYFVNAC
jgi:hypothetical protein